MPASILFLDQLPNDEPTSATGPTFSGIKSTSIEVGSTTITDDHVGAWVFVFSHAERFNINPEYITTPGSEAQLTVPAEAGTDNIHPDYGTGTGGPGTDGGVTIRNETRVSGVYDEYDPDPSYTGGWIDLGYARGGYAFRNYCGIFGKVLTDNDIRGALSGSGFVAELLDTMSPEAGDTFEEEEYNRFTRMILVTGIKTDATSQDLIRDIARSTMLGEGGGNGAPGSATDPPRLLWSSENIDAGYTEANIGQNFVVLWNGLTPLTTVDIVTPNPTPAAGQTCPYSDAGTSEPPSWPITADGTTTPNFEGGFADNDQGSMSHVLFWRRYTDFATFDDPWNDPTAGTPERYAFETSGQVYGTALGLIILPESAILTTFDFDAEATVAVVWDEDEPLTADIDGEATVAVVWDEDEPVTADIDGEATLGVILTGDITVTPGFDGEATFAVVFQEAVTITPDFDGEATVTAVLQEDITVTPGFDGEATFAVDFAGAEDITADIDGEATLVVVFDTDIALTADIDGEATVTAVLQEAVTFTPGIDGEATVTVVLDVEGGLTATFAGEASVVVVFQEAVTFTPDIDGEATFAVVFQEDATVTADIDGEATLAVVLDEDEPLTETFNGEATVAVVFQEAVTVTPGFDGEATLAVVFQEAVTVTPDFDGEATLAVDIDTNILMTASVDGEGTLAVILQEAVTVTADIDGEATVTVVFQEAGTVTPDFDGEATFAVVWQAPDELMSPTFPGEATVSVEFNQQFTNKEIYDAIVKVDRLVQVLLALSLGRK